VPVAVALRVMPIAGLAAGAYLVELTAAAGQQSVERTIRVSIE
jgi:hypothetical protein